MNVSIPLHIFLLFAWLAVASVGPGLFFVRRLHWKPLETLCASVGVSLVLIYVASLGIYAANLPAAAAHRTLAAIFCAMTIFSMRDLTALVTRRHIRRVLGAFAILWGWVLLQAMEIRHFSGGFWYGDWIEHYKRSLYFLDHWDVKYKFLNMYFVTARPPAMNLICAHFMAIFGQDFVVYQIVAGYLNLLPALACLMWATMGIRRGWGRAGAMAAVVVLLAASPLFNQSVAFPWTKSFTAFPCLLAAWFYLRGWVKQDRARMIAGFGFAAMACVVHYYAVAWAGGLAIHYVTAVWHRRKEKVRELAGIAAAVAVAAGPWFAWAIWEFGPKFPFATNTTAWAVHELSESEKIRTVGFNFSSTIEPFFFRHVPYNQFAQNDWLGRWRDLIFCLYQTNGIFVWGICGGAVLLAALRRNRWPGNVRRFWWILLASSAAMGIISIPTSEDWGTMDLWGLPHLLLGLCFLASMLGEMRLGWRLVAAIGCAIDFLGGILLQIHLEHRSDASGLSHFAQKNFLAKQVLGYRFIGDAFAGGLPIELLLCAGMAAMLIVFIRLEPSRRAQPVRSEPLAA
jgi:hypothetical protein